MSLSFRLRHLYQHPPLQKCQAPRRIQKELSRRGSGKGHPFEGGYILDFKLKCRSKGPVNWISGAHAGSVGVHGCIEEFMFQTLGC